MTKRSPAISVLTACLHGRRVTDVALSVCGAATDLALVVDDGGRIECVVPYQTPVPYVLSDAKTRNG